jgi:Tol biopolymer transport system component
MGKEEGPRALQLLDLKTSRVTVIPQSDGLFSPRWSPDGRYLAAISLDQRRLALLDMQTMKWRTLADTSVADPVWASDSKSIFFHAAQAETEPIYRVQIASGRLDEIANLSNFIDGETADYFFCGLTSDERPIIRSRLGTGDVYSMDLDSR